MGPLPEETLKRLAEFDTPTICNAVEDLETRDPTEGYMGLDVKCMFPELGRMVGYAVTATGRSTVPGQPPKGDGFAQWYELVEESPRPTVLVLKDVGHDRHRSCHFGDVMGTISVKLGALGLVTDGGVRDIETVKEMGFRYFAAGAVPAHGYPEIVSAGLDVTISGAHVRTGDLIHADENGVCVFPPEIADRVIARAEEVMEIEEKRRATITTPGFKAADLRNLS